ncbi:MAG: class I SAM-dependent methyltransferase [Opitutaceae bacterium]|nr:class I SAM-dependent methyltransferase [Verrucomicrobiales bacterium]
MAVADKSSDTTGQCPGGAFLRGSWRQRLFACGCARCAGRYEQKLRSRKAGLFSSLRGDVIEIGPGAGANFPLFPKQIRWVGIDPNPAMRCYLLGRAAAAGIEADLRLGTAERIEAPDDSFDFVVGTLVLCSVPDVSQVLREVRRVLKTGGSFLFVEHVAAPRGTMRRRIQWLLRPAFRFFGDGCHPDRETWVNLEQAGFAQLDLERFTVQTPVGLPHIAGRAVR